MKTNNKDIIMQNVVFLWLALITGFILLIPLIAMQFTSEVNWNLFDFVIMGILLFGTSFLFVQVARVTPRKYRMLIGVGFLVVFLLMWVHIAVGIVDSWPLAGS